MEEVVLVDDQNRVIGTSPKAAVHGASTPLHRGFSLFLFNSRGEVLLQQRCRQKLTWPLVWSGSCCGHPGMGESTEDAIRGRLADELGIERVDNLREAIPDFRYQCVRDGIMEHELCPVWLGRYDGPVFPNPLEVEAYAWKGWGELVAEIQERPGRYSHWCELEIAQLAQKEMPVRHELAP